MKRIVVACLVLAALVVLPKAFSSSAEKPLISPGVEELVKNRLIRFGKPLSDMCLEIANSVATMSAMSLIEQCKEQNADMCLTGDEFQEYLENYFFIVFVDCVLVADVEVKDGGIGIRPKPEHQI